MKPRYWPLTPAVCRKAAHLIDERKVPRSCCALSDAAPYGTWRAAYEAAERLILEQERGGLNPAGILHIGEARQRHARVMYLELLALAMEDNLL